MQTHATSAPNPAARLPATLAEIILPDSAGAHRIARDAALIVAGSLLVALFAQIKVPLGFHSGANHRANLRRAGGRRIAGRLARRPRPGSIRHRGSLSALLRRRGVRLVLDPNVGRLHRGIHTAAGLVGWLCQLGWIRRPWILVAMLLGNAILYVPGLIQLNYFLPADSAAAWGCADLWQCGLLPFIPGDLAKLIAASLVVPAGWAALDRFAINRDIRPS